MIQNKEKKPTPIHLHMLNLQVEVKIHADNKKAHKKEKWNSFKIKISGLLSVEPNKVNAKSHTQINWNIFLSSVGKFLCLFVIE